MCSYGTGEGQNPLASSVWVYQPLVVGFGCKRFGSHWQMTVNNCHISRDVIWKGTKKVGARLAVGLCNSISWVKALSFCLHYRPGASMQGCKNLKRSSLNFEADQCKMEWGKIVYCWRKRSTVNNKEQNAAEGSNWISIMRMIKDNVLGRGNYRRVSVRGWKRSDYCSRALIGLGLLSKSQGYYMKWVCAHSAMQSPSAAQLVGGSGPAQAWGLCSPDFMDSWGFVMLCRTEGLAGFHLCPFCEEVSLLMQERSVTPGAGQSLSPAPRLLRISSAELEALQDKGMSGLSCGFPWETQKC